MLIRTRTRSSAASQIDWGRSHSPERVWAAKTKRMASTLVPAICLAVGGQVQAQTVMGTLACDASLVQPPEPAFSVPAKVQIEGNTLTWTREATGMREVVSAPVVNGVAVLDGYGGSVSANTRQAFWDWRIQGRLNVTTDGVAGDVQLLTKDGRTVQRRCTFATAGRAASLPPAAAQAAPVRTPVPAPTPSPSPMVAPPAAPVQVSPAPAQPPVIPDAGSAAKEEELRAREAALARREQSVSRRERALTQAPKPVAPPPTPKAAQPAAPAPAPIAAPAAPAKPSSPAALGDI